MPIPLKRTTSLPNSPASIGPRWRQRARCSRRTRIHAACSPSSRRAQSMDSFRKHLVLPNCTCTKCCAPRPRASASTPTYAHLGRRAPSRTSPRSRRLRGRSGRRIAARSSRSRHSWAASARSPPPRTRSTQRPRSRDRASAQRGSDRAGGRDPDLGEVRDQHVRVVAELLANVPHRDVPIKMP